MVPTIAAARAGATTGEWARTLREVFGSYRAPTGVGEAAPRRPTATSSELRGEVARLQEHARPPAEDPRRQARPRRPLQRRRADRRARARRGHGRRLRGHPPDARADRRLGAAGGRARDRPVDPLRLAPRADPGRASTRCARPASTRPSSSAGSSPSRTWRALREAGVAAVYTPKDFDITRIMRDIVALVGAARSARQSPWAAPPPTARRERRRGRPRRAPARARPERRARRAEPAREHRRRPTASRPPRCCARSPPPRSAARRPGTSSASPARPAPASRRCSPRCCARGARTAQTVAMLAVDPSSRRSGGSLLGDRARIDFDPADRGVLIRSTAAGERLGGLARADARRRAGARRRLRRRRDRDRRRRAGRDRGRRRRRHRRRRRAARQRRRAAVPEVRDHGDPRRARRHQGRPRADRAAHPARPQRRAALARPARRRACSPSPRCRRASGIDELSRRSTSTAPSSTSPRGGCARAAPARSPTSSSSTASAGLRALGGRAAARTLLAAEDPGLEVPALVAALERMNHMSRWFATC